MSVDSRVVPVQDSLAAGINFLARGQHPDGSWSDFWLPVGTSDAWVTAYIGLALHRVTAYPLLNETLRDLATGCITRAAAWLLAQPRPLLGWGYNATVLPDADSTAHALSLLARMALPIPDEALAFLKKHKAPGAGYSTYVGRDSNHRWAQSAPDITAAVLRALYDVGALDRASLALEWQALLGSLQDVHGRWQGYWWPTPNYATGLVLEVWQLAGRPALRLPVDGQFATGSAFDIAWAMYARRVCGGDTQLLLKQLLAGQAKDGGWLDAPILRVPPSHGLPAGRTVIARDARRLFTTATAITALLYVEHLPDKASIFAPAQHSRPTAARSATGRQIDSVIHQTACAAGFSSAGAQQAVDIFATLTRESLAEPAPWPSPQLSSLSGGIPIEFSANVGHAIKPALRYAVEVGDPYLDPYRRARSGVEAIARTAAHLGYDEAWSRVLPALEQLVLPELASTAALRFWIWGGVDQAAPSANQPEPSPALKLYANLLAKSGNARFRLERALRAAGIPLSPGLRAVLDKLDAVGFLHETGFGLGKNGKFACKIYYELYGWRRALVREILEMVGLPGEPDQVCSAIPGILPESLSAKSRAGIAFRIDPATGNLIEFTTAMAFPPPLVSPAETYRRVRSWMDAQGWNAASYQAVIDVLLPVWEANANRFGRLHSLFTRTITPSAAWSAIYLRPYLAESIG
jgi:hypothetical protein